MSRKKPKKKKNVKKEDMSQYDYKIILKEKKNFYCTESAYLEPSRRCLFISGNTYKGNIINKGAFSIINENGNRVIVSKNFINKHFMIESVK